VGIGEAGG
jgi:hypothetical protein